MRGGTIADGSPNIGFEYLEESGEELADEREQGMTKNWNPKKSFLCCGCNCGEWIRPHAIFGWGTSLWILIWCIFLLGILLWCNLVYIAQLKAHVWTSREGYDTTTDLLPKDTIVYNINLYTDGVDLWTGCDEVFGIHHCFQMWNRDDVDPIANKTLGALILVWSVGFPFFKIIFTLLFWFFWWPQNIRAWTMWAKVNIGRWTMFESFFVLYWTYGFGFDDITVEIGSIPEPTIKPLMDYYAHVDACLYFSPVTVVFVLAQLASLAVSHYAMNKMEGALENRHAIQKSNNPCTCLNKKWRRNPSVYDGSMIPATLLTTSTTPGGEGTSKTIHKKKEVYTCLKYWDVDGYGPRYAVLLLVTVNFYLFIRVTWIDTYYTQYLAGSYIDVVPEFKNYYELGIWYMLYHLQEHGCGWASSGAAILFITLVVAPFIASLSLMLFWWAYIFKAPYYIKSYLRTTTLWASVYNCCDVAVMALYLSTIYFGQLVEGILSEPDKLTGVTESGPGWYISIVYIIMHWVLMAHCCTRPILDDQFTFGKSVGVQN